MKLQFILVLAVALSLAACDKPAEKSQINGHGIRVDTLFVDEDGCKVKRFEDARRNRYYVVCPHADAMTSSSNMQYIGKTTTTQSEEITTTVK